MRSHKKLRVYKNLSVYKILLFKNTESINTKNKRK